jgi:hypothetical protein
MTQLIPFASDVWIVEGPTVSFFGFPYPTRSAIIRLSTGSSWIWSPVAYSQELADEIVKTVGPVKYLVSPNKLHWLFLKEWKDRLPEEAKLLVAPGLKERRVAKGLEIDGVLEDGHPDDGYAADIDQIIFQGGAMDEAVFFHRASGTAIFADLLQRHRVEDQTGLKGWLMKVDGMVGPSGSTPREWRFIFWICGLLPAARDKLLKILDEWQPNKLIVAHGENAEEGATAVIANCLSWIPQQREPRERACCSP